MSTLPVPQLVIADGAALNPGDLSWAPLERLTSVTAYDRCGPLLTERLARAEIVLTNKEVLDARVLEQLPRLRFVSILATGTNVVDLQAARDRGIIVSNVPAYSTASVVQHTFALLLALTNKVAEHHAAAVGGAWQRSGEFSYRLNTIEELAGKTIGIVGLGAIGRGVATVAAGFGMTVIAGPRHGDTSDADEVARVPLAELFRNSDVVSLHCPLTAGTQGLINAQSLGKMKPTALLINTGRGPLIDEPALAEALGSGRIAGAALDVLSQEPPVGSCSLLTAPRCLITPHIAWASLEARQRLLKQTVSNVESFLAGAPCNVVN